MFEEHQWGSDIAANRANNKAQQRATQARLR